MLPSLIGNQYEQSIRRKLKTVYSTIPATAGFGSGPDLIIPAIQQKNLGQDLKVEVKTTTGADFGQRSITFQGSSWTQKPNKKDNPRHVSLYNYLFNTFNLSNKIQSAWSLPDNNITAQDLQVLVETNQINKVLYYEKIYQNATKKRNPFPEVTLLSGKTVLDAIISFYNSKGVYYIQIKGSGFYILGDDVKNLNSLLGVRIPKFAPSNPKLVLRGKPSNSGRTYRPVLTFKSSTVSPSSYKLDNSAFISSLYNNF